MICAPCANAGELNADGHVKKAKKWHGQCSSPNSCTCQHRVGEGHVEKSNANQEGGSMANVLPRESGALD